MVKGPIYSKEIYEKKKRKKIEIDRFRKHKMLSQYEKLARAEGLISSSRVNLSGSISASKTDEANVKLSKNSTPELKKSGDKIPFSKQRQQAAALQAERLEKQAELKRQHEEIAQKAENRRQRNETFRRRSRGKPKLGLASIDILNKLTKDTK